MKRLLIFSHACVVPANRELFLQLSQNFDLKIVAPQRWKGSLISDLQAMSSSQIEVFPVFGSGNGSLFFYLSRFLALRAWEPDLIFVDEEPWSLVALQVFLFFPKQKKVFYTKQNLKKNVPWPFGWIQQFIFKASSAAFVISQEAEQVLRWKKYLGEAVELPHSFNLQRFQPIDGERRRQIRASHGLPPEAFLVGYFGRLTEEKGLKDLEQTAKQLLSKEKNLAFVVVGNGPMREGLLSFSFKYPEQFFVLPALAHDRVQSLMAGIDLAVLPSRTTKSWKEQFGRVIIESAACGVPILGSDSGEIPHLIGKIQGGAVFPEGDPTAMALQIQRFLQDKEFYGSQSSQGLKKVREDFSHESVGKFLSSRLLQVLEQTKA